jgi:hypothetical protein
MSEPRSTLGRLVERVWRPKRRAMRHRLEQAVAEGERTAVGLVAHIRSRRQEQPRKAA